MRVRGFSLVELLTTVTIVAVLCAIAAPVFRAGRVAMAQQKASFALKNLAACTSLYLADSDETYPLGMQREGSNLRTWFGFVNQSNQIDTQQGFLSAYLGPNPPSDPTAPTLRFLGNGSGFGYNYETLGSDLTETNDFTTYPDCRNAASVSSLTEPSSTIAFGTASFYRPVWEKNGDGNTYEFGFLTPPWAWNGNPTLSFRHQGERTTDQASRKTSESGNALVLFADGRAKALRQGAVTDKLFLRNPASFSAD